MTNEIAEQPLAKKSRLENNQKIISNFSFIFAKNKNRMCKRKIQVFVKKYSIFLNGFFAKCYIYIYLNLVNEKVI
ncbi:hypothetical protein BpHYR1_042408 [Brachionus plicatilis]|uniref:Uncharacterized protein n=1 Tax=Brachionus plicatilis TaxID=10195 RepID=A0A3M7RJ16_BRAPC|nr:hypothetical protein BpHYR1_042408 [Brachionus plicatilis]